jgi:hypothetical protein
MIESNVIDTHAEEPLTTQDLVDRRQETRRDEKHDEKRDDGRAIALFAPDEAQTLRGRWEKIQIGFVDEPRDSVQQADQLVATVIQRLAEIFASERNRLEGDWGKGDSASTEDLRMALRRYRSLFDRLLSV